MIKFSEPSLSDYLEWVSWHLHKAEVRAGVAVTNVWSQAAQVGTLRTGATIVATFDAVNAEFEQGLEHALGELKRAIDTTSIDRIELRHTTVECLEQFTRRAKELTRHELVREFGDQAYIDLRLAEFDKRLQFILRQFDVGFFDPNVADMRRWVTNGVMRPDPVSEFRTTQAIEDQGPRRIDMVPEPAVSPPSIDEGIIAELAPEPKASPAIVETVTHAEKIPQGDIRRLIAGRPAGDETVAFHEPRHAITIGPGTEDIVSEREIAYLISHRLSDEDSMVQSTPNRMGADDAKPVARLEPAASPESVSDLAGRMQQRFRQADASGNDDGYDLSTSKSGLTAFEAAIGKAAIPQTTLAHIEGNIGHLTAPLSKSEPSDAVIAQQAGESLRRSVRSSFLTSKAIGAVSELWKSLRLN